MYQAVRTISESCRDGSVRFHQAGSIIPGFASWTYVTRKALLEHGKVVEVSGTEEEPAMEGRVLAVSGPTIAGPVLACEHCPGKTFATEPGLKLHMTRKHRNG